MERVLAAVHLNVRVGLAAAALAAGIAAPTLLRVRPAFADYPDRPVKFVVANTPGGPSDLVGRVVPAALEQAMQYIDK